MTNTTISGAKKQTAHMAVSLPRAFAAEVTAVADQSGRSTAKQLEHAFRLAQTIEQVLPAATVQALKSGALPPTELLMGLAAVLQAPAESVALKQALDANPVRVHFDRADPSKAYQRQADGTEVEGRVLDNGDFVPSHSKSASTKASKKHEPHQEAPDKAAPEAAKRSRKRAAEAMSVHA